MKGLGLQQRGHPVAGDVRARRSCSSATSYWPVWSQVSSTSSRSLSIMMYARSLCGTRREFARQARGERGARLGAAGANDADDALVGAQLDAAGDQIEGALVGVAFLEQHAAGIQLAELRLAGERVQVLRLQSVEGREVSQYCESRPVVHPSSNSPAPLGHNPMILAANATHMLGSPLPSHIAVDHSPSSPAGIRAEALAVAPLELREARSRCSRCRAISHIAGGRREKARTRSRRSPPHRADRHPRPRPPAGPPPLRSASAGSAGPRDRAARPAAAAAGAHRLAVPPDVKALAALAAELLLLHQLDQHSGARCRETPRPARGRRAARRPVRPRRRARSDPWACRSGCRPDRSPRRECLPRARTAPR